MFVGRNTIFETDVGRRWQAWGPLAFQVLNIHLLIQNSVRKEVSICRAAVELRGSPSQDTGWQHSRWPCAPSKRAWPKVNEECQLMTVSGHCRHPQKPGVSRGALCLLAGFVSPALGIVVKNANRSTLKMETGPRSQTLAKFVGR